MKSIYPIIVLIGIALVCANESVYQTTATAAQPTKHVTAERSGNDFDIPGLIEKMITEVRKRIPEIITFSDVHVFIPQNKFLWGHIDLTNMSFSGLKEFNATILYRPFINIPKEYIIVLEQLKWNAHYKTNISILNMPLLTIFGEGQTKVTLNKFNIDGNLSLSLLPINASTSVDINLEGVAFNISGLQEDEKFSRDLARFLGDSVEGIFQMFGPTPTPRPHVDSSEIV